MSKQIIRENINNREWQTDSTNINYLKLTKVFDGTINFNYRWPSYPNIEGRGVYYKCTLAAPSAIHILSAPLSKNSIHVSLIEKINFAAVNFII